MTNRSNMDKYFSCGPILLFLAVTIVMISELEGAKIAKDMFFSGLDKPLEQYPFPQLPFAFNALEPHIDGATMELHYGTIFKNHTVGLNKLLKKWRNSKDKSAPVAKTSLINIWRNHKDLPEPFARDFFNHGGGYLNHLLYFSTMSPPKNNPGKKFSAKFTRLIDRSFHNSTHMKSSLRRLASEVFGSGWVYLARAVGWLDSDYLTVIVTHEEMAPLNNPKITPILALDMWEHAYFKKYGADRMKYFDNWWETIDWMKVERIFNWWREFEGYSEKNEL